MRSFWLSLFASVAALVSADDGFQVTTPAAGDTIAILDENYGKVTLKIEWTVPQAIADRPVMLSLSQGDSEEEMEDIELIASAAKNNGTYSWTSYLDNTAPSGCNYTILAKSWTDYAYSGYFTITNPDDGGLDPSWTCPVDVGRSRPSNGSYEAPAASTDTSTGGEDDSASGGSAERSNAGGSGSGGGGGVSTTTLAVAVAVPIVVLLIVFAVVIVLGIRRGWFLRKQDRAVKAPQSDVPAPTTSTPGNGHYPTMQEQEKGSDNIYVGELHGHDRPHQFDGNAIYQLDGDQGRR